MARHSQQPSKGSPSRKKASEAVSKDGTRRPLSAAARSRAVEPAPRILDDRTRRDMVGVGFVLLGIVLFIAAVAPTGAIVTSFLSDTLHLVFGVGCYIMPFFLVAVGAIVLYRRESERMSLRITVGLGLILVALLGIIALFTPIGNTDPSHLFDHDHLISHGGYVGAALAWVGLTLFGAIISAILLLGVGLTGVIVIGFSVSAFIEKVRARHEADLAAQAPYLPEALFGAVKRGGHIVRHGLGGAPSADTAPPDAAVVRPAAMTARISLEEQPRRRSRPLDASGAPDGRAVTQVAGESPAATCAVDGAAITRSLGANGPAAGRRASVPATAPDPRQTAAIGDISAEEPARPMTRKLGKKAAAEAAAPKAASGNPRAKAAKPKAKPAPAQPAPSKDGFQLPSMGLLATGEGTRRGSTEEELREVAAELQGTLEDFGVLASVVGWVEGPTVTLFKVDLPSGVRVSKVTNLTDDIALALAAPGVRIFAPIPGTNYVGIEVPNRKRQMVYLPEVLAAAEPGPLQVAIGEDVEGHAIVHDLAKMPHVLIAGTTGSGKSVEVNGMIMSILMRATPAEVRFIMVDPKRVEFAPYEGIPHLYVPVVTECREASSALSWAVAEMERRLKMFSKCGVRNIISFNEKARAATSAAAAEQSGGEVPENPYGEPIPYIVIVIDELADLMMNVGKEVEFSISRIAQLARAAGIHLIIATQRPSTNVVTGLIKANITCRIGLTVASGIDSRVILDSTGAENLIGHGDLLIAKPEYPKPVRVQGPYVSDEEIAAVVAHLKAQGEPEYHSEILKTNVVTLGDSSPAGDGGSEADDPLLWEAADVVVSSDLGSTSNLQRRLKVGYARAGRIMDQLEEKGIVGPANGSRPREVLVDQMELETLKAFEANDED